MRITHYYNPTSKSAEYMRHDMQYNEGATIYTAYNNPSTAKIRAWEAIRENYTREISNYNGNPCHTVYVPTSMHCENNVMYLKYIRGSLHVVSTSSHFFTTCALFECMETGQYYIIKETHCNTYMCEA